MEGSRWIGLAEGTESDKGLKRSCALAGARGVDGACTGIDALCDSGEGAAMLSLCEPTEPGRKDDSPSAGCRSGDDDRPVLHGLSMNIDGMFGRADVVDHGFVVRPMVYDIVEFL